MADLRFSDEQVAAIAKLADKKLGIKTGEEKVVKTKLAAVTSINWIKAIGCLVAFVQIVLKNKKVSADDVFALITCLLGAVSAV
jgi:hypothetical protein